MKRFDLNVRVRTLHPLVVCIVYSSGCSKDTFGIVKCPNPDYVYGLWTAPSSQSEGASSDGVYFIEVMPDTNGGDALPCGWSFTGSFALAMEPVEK